MARERDTATDPPAPPRTDADARAADTAPGCPTGVCGADVPPLVGTVLTGSGLTIAQAAAALARGERPPLTDVQRRIVERWAEQRGG